MRLSFVFLNPVVVKLFVLLAFVYEDCLRYTALLLGFLKLFDDFSRVKAASAPCALILSASSYRSLAVSRFTAHFTQSVLEVGVPNLLF